MPVLQSPNQNALFLPINQSECLIFANQLIRMLYFCPSTNQNALFPPHKYATFLFFQARIKAKPLLSRSAFVPKNGFKQPQPAPYAAATATVAAAPAPAPGQADPTTYNRQTYQYTPQIQTTPNMQYVSSSQVRSPNYFFFLSCILYFYPMKNQLF